MITGATQYKYTRKKTCKQGIFNTNILERSKPDNRDYSIQIYLKEVNMITGTTQYKYTRKKEHANREYSIQK